MRATYPLVAFIVFSLLTPAAFGRGRVQDIEFFGYQGIASPERLRKELPIHEGDALNRQTKERLRRAVEQITGWEPTDVEAICCDARGDAARGGWAALTYPLLVENALPPSSIAPEHPLLPRVTVGSKNVRASIPTIQVRL